MRKIPTCFGRSLLDQALRIKQAEIEDLLKEINEEVEELTRARNKKIEELKGKIFRKKRGENNSIGNISTNFEYSQNCIFRLVYD